MILSLQCLQLGPLDWYLFDYGGNVVAINFVGGVLPLVASATISVLAIWKSHRLELPRCLFYLLLVVLIGLVDVLMFCLSSNLLGGLGMPTPFFLLLALGAALAYNVTLGKNKKVLFGMLELYALGTYSMLLSDLVRTFSKQLDVSPQIYGAGGLNDGVFLFGIYTAMFFALFRLIKDYLKSYANTQTRHITVLYRISYRLSWAYDSLDKMVGRALSIRVHLILRGLY